MGGATEGLSVRVRRCPLANLGTRTHVHTYTHAHITRFVASGSSTERLNSRDHMRPKPSSGTPFSRCVVS
eukprot:6119559-Pyramimonas_sp.AAC.1